MISDGQRSLHVRTGPCGHATLPIRDHVTINYSSLLQYHLRKMPRWHQKVVKANLLTLPWYLILNMSSTESGNNNIHVFTSFKALIKDLPPNFTLVISCNTLEM